MGQAQPPSGSISSDAQHAAAVNEGATKQSTGTTGGNANPTSQSQQDRVENFEQAAQAVGSKMANDPQSVTKEEGDLLHSREQVSVNG